MPRSAAALRFVAPALVALSAACGSASEQQGRLEARVTVPPRDSLRFETPASASPCREGGAVVLQGVEHGNGVLVWLRFGESLGPGDYPVLARGDTSAPRGGAVSVRFMLGSAAHGLALDSGRVGVEVAGGRLTARAGGSGLDLTGAVRVTLDATFTAVSLGTATVACRAHG